MKCELNKISFGNFQRMIRLWKRFVNVIWISLRGPFHFDLWSLVLTSDASISASNTRRLSRVFIISAHPSLGQKTLINFYLFIFFFFCFSLKAFRLVCNKVTSFSNFQFSTGEDQYSVPTEKFHGSSCTWKSSCAVRLKDFFGGKIFTFFFSFNLKLFFFLLWSGPWSGPCFVDTGRFYASRIIHDWKYCRLQFWGGTLNENSMKTKILHMNKHKYITI